MNAFKVAAWQIVQRFQFGCAINKVQSSEGPRQEGAGEARTQTQRTAVNGTCVDLIQL